MCPFFVELFQSCFQVGFCFFSRFDRRNLVSMDSAVRREDRTVRRGLPASLGHVAAGAPLTCGSTSELTNNVPHRPACRLHPQVGAAVSHKRGTTQNEVCAHDPSRVHSLWCIECFVFCLPCFAPQVLPLLFKGSPSPSRTCLTCIRLGQALSCRLLSRVV